MTVRWGILGTGWVARMFCDDLALEGSTIAAVGSRTEAAARDFAARYDVPRAHGSYQELVDDPEVDIIYVATPHPFHAEHAELAIRAGKNVLVEKPFTINAAEARRVVELADERGVLVMEAMWSRYLPHLARIDQVIASGTIGAVQSLVADHTQKLPADPAHRINDPALGGGALLDLGIYPLWYADHLFGAPEQVSATARWNETTGVDAADAIVLSYSGGRQAVLQCASDAQGPNRAAIVGTDGWIEIERVWYCPTAFTVYDASGSVVLREEPRVSGRGMQLQALAAERVLRGEAAELLDGPRSVQVMETMDAVRRAIGLTYPMESAPGVPA